MSRQFVRERPLCVVHHKCTYFARSEGEGDAGGLLLVDAHAQELKVGNRLHVGRLQLGKLNGEWRERVAVQDGRSAA